MRDEGKLIAKILVLAMAFAFSACGKSAAENVPVVPSSIITPAPALPESPIRSVDFGNFTYPWTEEMSSADEKILTLKNGKREFVINGQIGVSLSKPEYGDVTNDGEEEALINLSVQTGGSSMPNMIYVYTLENKKPKLLWSFDTGDRAEGGFKKIYAEHGELVVELFGDGKFENGKRSFDIPKGKFKGLCCPTVFTKNRFKWNGEKFVVEGTPELFDYDPKNQQKENESNQNSTAF
ncbi:MAG TPA: hypothetical protein VGC97_00410 [Pyrinomonadaceae bacterium]|jgi:hypothetical protein